MIKKRRPWLHTLHMACRTFASTFASAFAFVLVSTLACVFTFSLAAHAAPHGTLRIAVGASPATFDPHFNDLPVGNTVDMLVFEGLFRLDAENKVVPDLALDHEFSSDGLTFIVHMRSDHVFSNGDPLNAQAVAASFARLLDPRVGSIHRGLYAVIDRVSAADDATVVFHLKEPNGHILVLLAAPIASIINARALQAMGAEYGRKPVGSGPYVVESFVGGERYRLVPNPRYLGNTPATLAAIDFTVAPEDASRMALLETGAVDIAERVPPEAIATINALNHARVITPPSMFSINMEMVLAGPLQDARVREALNLAIDRAGIVQGVLGGLGSPSVGMPGPGTQDELRVIFEPIAYDPDRARALLSEAGYPPGALKLTITCPTGRFIKDAQACQAIAGLLQGVGVDARAHIVDLGSLLKTITTPLAQRTDHMAMLGRATPGMDFTLTRLFRSDISSNVTGFRNARVNQLLSTGRAAKTLEEQRRIYGEIQQIIWEEKPFIFLWYQTQALGIARRVQGFSVQPNETMVLDRVTMAL